MAFATPRISSHNALKDAVPALWYLLRLFVSPLQRAGTCEAHGIGLKWLLKVLSYLPWSLLKLDVLKNRVLERSGLDFGASGPRFWRLWASIFADFKGFRDRFFGKKLARKCFLPAGSD